MSKNIGTNVGAPIVPNDSEDTFGATKMEYVEGGRFKFANRTALYAHATAKPDYYLEKVSVVIIEDEGDLELKLIDKSNRHQASGWEDYLGEAYDNSLNKADTPEFSGLKLTNPDSYSAYIPPAAKYLVVKPDGTIAKSLSPVFNYADATSNGGGSPTKLRDMMASMPNGFNFGSKLLSNSAGFTDLPSGFSGATYVLINCVLLNPTVFQARFFTYSDSTPFFIQPSKTVWGYYKDGVTDITWNVSDLSNQGLSTTDDVEFHSITSRDTISVIAQGGDITNTPLFVKIENTDNFSLVDIAQFAFHRAAFTDGPNNYPDSTRYYVLRGRTPAYAEESQSVVIELEKLLALSNLNTPEDVANKVSDFSDPTSVVKYPNIKAVADYVEQEIAGIDLGYTPENSANKATDLTDSTSIVKYPNVKSVVDALAAILVNTSLTGTPQVPLNPVNANSPVSKGHFDNQLFALNWKYSCRASTTAALPAYSVSGDFQSITASANGALPAQDGVTLIVGDRLLVKNEVGASRVNHGSWLVSQAGDSGSPWILTRYSDSNTAERLLAATYRVREGTIEGNKAYAVNVSPIVLGTTEITFAQVAGAGQYTNGTGLLLNGNAFSPDFATNSEQITGTASNKVSNPAAVKAQITDEKKNYTKDVGLVSGTQYENVLPIPLKAGQVTAASGDGISNIRYSTTYGGSYATLSSALPLTVNAGNLFIKFDYTTVGELAGSITITGKDN